MFVQTLILILFAKGLFIMSWELSLFLNYNYLNNNKQNLILKWMKITYEIPAKNDEDYNVIGLSKDENKQFWLKEDELNHRYNRLFNIYVVATCLIFNNQLLFIIYEGIDVYTYVIVTIIHYIHASYYMYLIFHMIYTLNFFYITILNIFRKKFNYISRQLEHLQDKKVKLNNQKLNELIYDFNYVYLELINLNDYFKNLPGICFVHYFVCCIPASFIFMLNENLSVQFVGYIMLIILYILVFYFPSQYSSFLIAQISFENENLLKQLFNQCNFCLYNFLDE